MRRVAIATLGCKVNQYDSDALALEFSKAGFDVVPFGDRADVYVVNTCTVTQMGDKKSRQLIRRAHARNPEAVIVATGCYAQASPREVAAIPGASVVSGTSDRAGIVRAVIDLAENGGAPAMLVSEVGECRVYEELPSEGTAERTRAYIKIEDGCENFCSYCKVPYVRGPVRSRDFEHIREEVRRLAARGFREIVLTGIDLGAYGRDFGGSPSLADVLEMAANAQGIARVRVSSVDPTDVTDRLLDIMGSEPAVCPHLHVPLQSGDDEVLRRMNRRYTGAEFEEVVARARARVPDLAVTSDVIVGFPGEDEPAFEATMSLCGRVGFSRLHVFQYSRRRGTVAAGLAGQVAQEEKQRRSERLIALGRELALKFHRGLMGQTVQVLVEKSCGAVCEGLTGSYVRVVASRATENGRSAPSPGAMAAVRVTEAQEGFVRGVVEGSAEGV
ncbi:MAG TPA: tRNA (N(6)-L-threonylcarbamoyladenosine(37)-C(2))-methylthiotransferase MtaB [Bacillota bacterium]|nr:tRNA (N(6)-L-threonylcarbamoyladenosine(37)-C(2))-methylthiotransferase MtaB [Bacillota bacterium]